MSETLQLEAKQTERQVRVFLIEDNGFDLRDFQRKLAAWSRPSALAWATDGEAAIERLLKACEGPDRQVPDVIVLDLNMPRANGFQVLSFLRQHPVLGQVPTLIWTTSDSPFDMSTADDFRIEGYLLKRDKAARLHRSIEAALAKRPGPRSRRH